MSRVFPLSPSITYDLRNYFELLIPLLLRDVGGGGFNYKVIYKINYFIFLTNYTRNILPAVNTILIAVQFSLLLNPNVYAFIIVQRANQSVKN